MVQPLQQNRLRQAPRRINDGALSQQGRLVNMPTVTGPMIHPPAPNRGQPVIPSTQPVQQSAAPSTATPTPQQQFGLSGSEQALQGAMSSGLGAIQSGTSGALGTLQQGLGSALNQLNLGQQALSGNFSAGASSVDPTTGQPLFQQAASGVGAFSPAGLSAQQQQAALSGALGADAQRQAFNQFVESPEQAFLREQGQESIINQAAAIGGLGGGNVQKELARFGTGLASQDLQNRFNRLGSLSQQGLQAAGQQGQFLSQAGQQMGNLAAQNAQLQNQANLSSAANALQAAGQQASLFGQGAGLTGQLAGQGAGFQQQSGLTGSGLISGIGQQVSQGRLQAGRDIAGQTAATTSALANLANQQGLGISDAISSGAGNVSNLLTGFGQLDAQQQQQLATLLANLSVGAGTNQANIQQNMANIQQQGAAAQGQQQAQTGGAILGALASFFSDERLKDDIDKVGTYKGHNVYSWTWNDKMPIDSLIGEKGIGVIAQEVEKYAPELITEHKSGYKQVNYGGL